MQGVTDVLKEMPGYLNEQLKPGIILTEPIP